MFDVKIVGGTVVDGTGGAPRRADVAIKDGKIVGVGDVPGDAKRTLDASGCIVTPGFVDVHTHYDGQVTWDADLLPSSAHGVTTAVIGSCGVGFAPVRKQDHDRLIALMEGVEDIPVTALAEGLDWRWESFPEYLSAIDFPHAIDFAAHIVHDPLRVYVMGERATAFEPATDEDIARMRKIVREALDAGAIGFSTGRTDNHRINDGSPTPASEATERELCGIAEALRGRKHGVLQAVSDFDLGRPERFDGEFELLVKMAKAAQRPISISLLQRQIDSEQWKRIVKSAEKATAEGTPFRLQVGARGIGVLLGLEATFHPFMGFPSYKAIANLPLEERVRRMRDPELKARMLKEKSEKVAGDGSAIPPLADQLLQNIDFVAMSLWRLGDQVQYEPSRETSLFGDAMRRGVTPLEAIYDALLENEGRELLYFPIYNYMEGNLDAVHQMLTHPLAMAGLSDGGAHVGTICDASFPTFMLTWWARDRPKGRIPLERVVQMMTSDTARYMGFDDRGSIEVGKKADLNVIDHAHLRVERPRLVRDLPAGGKRLLQDAIGYRATLVSGQIILENDELTGVRPGRLVRLKD
ncbi:MAG: amidohydrolase family protein [Sandaracinaceae bacterium]|nr:amidohydrolase family protein [Sandaracinaceae bacterium]